MDGEPKDLVWSLDLYAALGVPVQRTILGLPLYGVTWPVIGPGFVSPSTGRGDTWVPRRNLRRLRAIPPSRRRTIRSRASSSTPSRRPSRVPVLRPTSPGVPPSATPEPIAWNAVYYDSPRSLTPKLRLADDRGLAGAGFWAIGYERGLPGYTEMIATFAAGKLLPP